jgi:hypothetical protein
VAEARDAGQTLPEGMVRLDLAVLLPDAPDARDACVRRLVAELEGRPGVARAHVLPAGGGEPATAASAAVPWHMVPIPSCPHPGRWVVLRGRASLDEASITGESQPADKRRAEAADRPLAGADEVRRALERLLRRQPPRDRNGGAASSAILRIVATILDPAARSFSPRPAAAVPVRAPTRLR